MKSIKFCYFVYLFSVFFACGVFALSMSGDVNGDSNVDICDAMIALRYISNGEISEKELIADVNGDGKVSVIDVARILKHLSNPEVALINHSQMAINNKRLAEWQYTLDEENGIIKLDNYISDERNVYVPATFTVNGTTYKTMVITSLSTQKSAFTDKSQTIRSVFFEDGVMANEMSYMFRTCVNLLYVNQYPEYDGVWWTGVFNGCSHLVSAPPIPNDIEGIRITGFFMHCRNLIGDYSMPDSYNSNYARDVFLNCNNINKPINVIWFGDSITAGTSTKGVSFVNYLSKELKDVAIANVAVGGRTLGYGYDLAEKDMVASIVFDLKAFGVIDDVDYVFVSAGTNDFAHLSSRRPYGTYRFSDIGSIDDFSPHTLCGAMNVVISDVREKFPNATLTVTTPITRSNYDVKGAKVSDNSELEIFLKDFVDAIKSVCEMREVPYFDAYLESGMEVLKDSCDGNGDYFADKTHPTLVGQRKLADYFIEKMVSAYGFEKVQ